MTDAGHVWIVTEQALFSNNTPIGTLGLKLNNDNETEHITVRGFHCFRCQIDLNSRLNQDYSNGMLIVSDEIWNYFAMGFQSHHKQQQSFPSLFAPLGLFAERFINFNFAPLVRQSVKL